MNWILILVLTYSAGPPAKTEIVELGPFVSQSRCEIQGRLEDQKNRLVSSWTCVRTR
jgi:redox-sensitive bicupin YhaK (pirin superfamily)